MSLTTIANLISNEGTTVQNVSSNASIVEQTPYVGYTYAYPHKTAYRPLDPPIPLRTLWAEENRDALFLYLHVPFCEMRCGFCNLFTTANPKGDFAAVYLQALQRQADEVRDALREAKFARFAIGGGTPTFLDVAGLQTLFRIAKATFGVDTAAVPVSVETSPRTADKEKLSFLREQGVDRISIGVQSFLEAEVGAVGRAQKDVWVEEALEQIRSAGFPTLNIDLIYGLPGQTVTSWLCSLQTALRYAPEELFLYPLYVRPLTGLGRKATREAQVHDDLRLDCYRAGREFLLANGYTQISMRMFARSVSTDFFAANRPLSVSDPSNCAPVDFFPSNSSASNSPAFDVTSAQGQARKPEVAYCCQEDGMVGVGCGARSYTRRLHYASEYAVGATGVREILRDYVTKPTSAFERVDYGFALNDDEQRRRYILQSLLQVAGIDRTAYRQRFGTDVEADFPQLRELKEAGLAVVAGQTLQLTSSGIERSDRIGPWLYSPLVEEQMLAYELR